MPKRGIRVALELRGSSPSPDHRPARAVLDRRASLARAAERSESMSPFRCTGGGRGGRSSRASCRRRNFRSPAERPDPQDFQLRDITPSLCPHAAGEGRLAAPCHAARSAHILPSRSNGDPGSREAYPDACERAIGARAGDSSFAATPRASVMKRVEIMQSNLMCRMDRACEALRGILTTS